MTWIALLAVLGVGGDYVYTSASTQDRWTATDAAEANRLNEAEHERMRDALQALRERIRQLELEAARDAR